MALPGPGPGPELTCCSSSHCFISAVPEYISVLETWLHNAFQLLCLTPRKFCRTRNKPVWSTFKRELIKRKFYSTYPILYISVRTFDYRASGVYFSSWAYIWIAPITIKTVTPSFSLKILRRTNSSENFRENIWKTLMSTINGVTCS